MKKIVLAAIGLSAMMMNMSCSKEIVTDENQKGLVNVSIEAKEGTESATKVSYDYDSASKYAFSWSDAENIKVFIGSDGYTFTKGDGDRFSGTVEAFENKNISAVWPSSSVSTLAADATSVSVNVPTTVTVGADDYTSSLLVAQTANVADVASLTSLSFHQAMAIIKLQVLGIPSDKAVTKVKITAGTENAITASASVELSTGVSTTTSTASDVEVNVSGAESGSNTIVNIALLPAAAASTYTFTIYSGETELGSYTTKSVTFTRNNIYSVNIDCLYSGVTALADLSDGMVVNTSYTANGKIVNLINGTSTAYATVETTSPAILSNSAFGYYNSNSNANSCASNYCIPLSDDIATVFGSGYTFEVIAAHSGSTRSSSEEKIIGRTQAGGTSIVKTNINGTMKVILGHHDGTWRNTDGEAIDENVWYKIVAVWYGPDQPMKIYFKSKKNGEVTVRSYGMLNDSVKGVNPTCLTNTVVTTNVSYNSSLGISGNVRYVENGLNWEGPIAEARAWKRALSEDEINALLAQTPDSFFSEPVSNSKR